MKTHMTQRSIEMIVGRLVTDEEFRARFVRAPYQALVELVDRGPHVSHAEVAALIATDEALSEAGRRARRPQAAESQPEGRVRTAVTRRLALCCLFSLSPALAAGQSAPAAPRERLSVDAAIRMALDHNRQLASATLELDKADADVAVQRTRRLPSFETSVSASQLLTPVAFMFPQGAFGDIPGAGPIPAADTRVTSPQQPIFYISAQATQPLTELKRIGLGIRAAAASRDLERERLREDRLAVVNDVRRLYFAILQTESALAATDEAIALYTELGRTLDVRVTQKVALRSDSLDVQARLAQETFNRTSRANTLASQKEQLNQLLGRDVRTAFDLEGVAPASALDIDLAAAQTRALDERPDVREARVKLQQAEIARESKKAERIPDVSLAVSYTSNINIDVLPRNLATLGVQFKWEPFDWGRHGRELAGKSHTLEQARLAVREAEDRAVIEINSRYRTLAETRAYLSVAELAQTAAREKLRVKTNQFQIQAAMLTDVLQQRSDVASMNDRYQQALLAFWTAKADFEHAVGEDVIR
jgi:outer membrane protein TolC